MPRFVLLCTLLLSACAGEQLSPREGFLPVEGGKVWYRVVGEGRGTPLVVLHGGPGSPSDYLASLGVLGADRPVVFYDQLGAGRSDQPTDTTLWRMDRFIAELNTIRDSLRLREIHLLGHSWGSMLATDYMLTNPAGVRSLVLASPVVSSARWVSDADSLIRTLPDSIQRIIRRNEAAKTYQAPAYLAAVQVFYSRFLSRRTPPPPEMDSTMARFGQGVYSYMWGPSEFTATGTLKDYDRTADLPRLALPVLFTAGEFDEARPATVESYSRMVPSARFALIPNSAHMTSIDAPIAFADTVRAFLSAVEAR